MTAAAPDPTIGAAGTAPIEVRDVSRWFGDVLALHRVSLEVHAGVTGLLGPNGAGKTSLLRILVGLHPTSEGEVRVLGRDPRRHHNVHAHVGYVPESGELPERVTARRFVRTLAGLRGVTDPDTAAADAIRTAGLDPDDRRPMKTYSKGMRQRAKVAAALAHQPSVLVLDEPLNGLDPQGRVEMMALLRDLGDQGVTVLVSSHVLHEVQRLAPRVIVMVQGRVAAEGTPRAIRDLMDDRPARIRVGTDRSRQLGAALVAEGLAETVRVDHGGRGDGVIVDTAAPTEFRDRLAGLARDLDAVVTEVVPLDEDLDSVFTYLVERGLR